MHRLHFMRRFFSATASRPHSKQMKVVSRGRTPPRKIRFVKKASGKLGIKEKDRQQREAERKQNEMKETEIKKKRKQNGKEKSEKERKNSKWKEKAK